MILRQRTVSRAPPDDGLYLQDPNQPCLLHKDKVHDASSNPSTSSPTKEPFRVPRPAGSTRDSTNGNTNGRQGSFRGRYRSLPVTSKPWRLIIYRHKGTAVFFLSATACPVFAATLSQHGLYTTNTDHTPGDIQLAINCRMEEIRGLQSRYA
jgi:hypothetical protein